MGKAGSLERPAEQVLRDHLLPKDSELLALRDLLGSRAAIRNNKEYLGTLPVEPLLFIKVRLCVVCCLVAEQMSKALGGSPASFPLHL